MRRKGLFVVAVMACALVAPLPAHAAGTTAPAGSTRTTLALCPAGPAGISDPGSSAPSGCGSTTAGGTTTLCKDADVHAFVATEVMGGAKRATYLPLAGSVAVHLQSPTYGFNQNVDTFPTYGSALLQIGSLPPGTYAATATLWSGQMTNPDGTTTVYTSSTTSMNLVVSSSPCGGTTAPTGDAKKGCGLGDSNHEHEATAGKGCPTK